MAGLFKIYEKHFARLCWLGFFFIFLSFFPDITAHPLLRHSSQLDKTPSVNGGVTTYKLQIMLHTTTCVRGHAAMTDLAIR